MTSDLSPTSVEQPIPPGRAAQGLGWLGLGAIALGIALRFALFATGRSALDGDEAIMGAMAYHVAHLEHFPLYFYGQHYMGALEIPPVALLMALVPAYVPE